MDRNQIFLMEIALLELLNVEPTDSVTALASIYLLHESETVCDMMSLFRNPQYRKVRSIAQITLLKNCLAAYQINYFGRKEEERKLLDAKERAIKLLCEEYGEDWDASSPWRYAEKPLSRSVIGLMLYYGWGRSENREMGEELLHRAAQENDMTALLWQLSRESEHAEDILDRLSLLPQSQIDPGWLEAWQPHERVAAPRVRKQSKRTIGFC